MATTPETTGKTRNPKIRITGRPMNTMKHVAPTQKMPQTQNAVPFPLITAIVKRVARNLIAAA